LDAHPQATEQETSENHVVFLPCAVLCVND
jgi:hypothetical protein